MILSRSQKSRYLLVSSRKGYYWVNYLIEKDFNVSGDDFILEARIKNPSNEGGISCYDPGVYVRGQNEKVAQLVFMSPGCTYYSRIGAADSVRSGRSVNLSALGRDFSDWVTVKLKVSNQTVSAYYQGQLVYTMPYQGEVGNITKIHQFFKGSGSMDWLKLYKSDGTLVYSEEFNSSEILLN